MVTHNRVGTEIERNGPARIRRAVSRLAEGRKTGKTSGSKLIVRDRDLKVAGQEMRRQSVEGRVQNLSNTKSYYVCTKRVTEMRRR